MNLNHLAVFLAVAETRSFTKAAERLQLDKGHVSRVLRSLEESFDARLVERTTRSVELTPAGLELAAHVAGPLAALERADRSMRDRPATPAGLVTLTTTPDIGRMLVAPALGAFRARYPAVRVKLVLEQRVTSLSDGSIDLALRVGKVGPAGAKARKLGELSAGFFAAPRYLAARGTPTKRNQLGSHDGLWPVQPKRKSFTDAGAPPPPAVDCDDFGALFELARAGAGVAVLPLFVAARDVVLGALVHVLPDEVLRGAPLYLLSTHDRLLSASTRALRDHLATHIPASLNER